MTARSPAPAGNDDLDFVETTRNAFRFLEVEHGFELARSTPTLVRYERGPQFVNVICEVGLNVLIGRNTTIRDGLRGALKRLRQEWGVEFPLEYVARDCAREEELGTEHVVLSTREDVQTHLPRLAEFTRVYAADLLSDNPDVYARMGKIARARSRELTEWATGNNRRSGGR